jgi:hypothetical protein
MSPAEYTTAREAAIRHRPVPKLAAPPVDKRLPSEMTGEEWTAAHPLVKSATDDTPAEYAARKAAILRR